MEKNQKKQIQRMQYVGPRALFDKNFIPTKIYGQKKKVETFSRFLSDINEDSQSSISILSGKKGMGKKLMVNRTLRTLKKEQNPYLLSLECETKNNISIIFDIAECVAKLNGKTLSDEFMLRGTSQIFWDIIVKYSEKITRPLIILLDSAELLDKQVMAKLVDLSKKRSRLNCIFSFNVSGSNFKLLDIYSSDMKISMNDYTQSELYSITRDRADMGLKNELPSPTIAYLVDTVQSYGNRTPGACIDFLKEIYPTLFENNGLSAEDTRLHTRYFFGNKSLDSISVADLLMESSVLDRLVLDNIVNYFKSTEKLYIPFKRIRESYNMGCEALEYEPNDIEFLEVVGNFVDNSVILPSPLMKAKAKRIGMLYNVPHFLTMPVNEISELIDVCFSNPEDEDDFF